MTQPVLYLGGSSIPTLLKAGVGYTDDSAPYELYARSRKFAIKEEGGFAECLWTVVHLTTKHYDKAVSLWVTAIVDDVAVATQRLDLQGVAFSQGEQQTHKLGLFQPYVSGGAERIRTAPRGTWFELVIETKYASAESGAAPVAAKAIVEAAEVEYQPVRSSRQAVRVTPG